MEQYHFSEQEQAFMESMEVPFAVFQLVEKRIEMCIRTMWRGSAMLSIVS